MKKITLQMLCLLFLTLSYGQTYTSGLFTVENPFNPGVTIVTCQIDINVTNNIVTTTIIGPDNSWLGMGFDAISMTSGKDIFLYGDNNDGNGAILTDRNFVGVGSEPAIDGQQDWTVQSNTTSGGDRTIVATRARDTGDSNDYVFPSSPVSLNVVGAYGLNTITPSYHGQNRGLGTANFSLLSIDQVNDIQFSMTPNPASSNLNIVLPSNQNSSATVQIFDVIGKRIYTGSLNNTHVSSIDVSSWNSGVYLVKVSNDNSTQTKRFVKQ